MAIVVKPEQLRARTHQTEAAFQAPRRQPARAELSATQPLLSVKATAQFLGLSMGWLNKARLTGSGPTYCLLGRRVLYSMPDLLSWL